MREKRGGEKGLSRSGRARQCEREACVLRWLSGRLPVPEVIGADETTLDLSLMPGVHGQDLIAGGCADQVLRASGSMLRRIQGLDLRPTDISAAFDHGLVLVHGDFGPNNVLLDASTGEITAVLDWEWAHIGGPGEDLAWCEWIVRTHHSDDVGSLDQFFAGYGACPPWEARQAAIVTRCRELLTFSEQWQRDSDSVRLWEC
jgi:aminoglycoside phosphotransferase